MSKCISMGNALDLLRRGVLDFSGAVPASVMSALNTEPTMVSTSTPDTPKRRVLLLEPNYKNKYPPMGLMKLSTYFKERGDDVRFFKGDLKTLAVELLFEELFEIHSDISLGALTQDMRAYIRTGKKAILAERLGEISADLELALGEVRDRFKRSDYPKFDIVGVTTLFTFFWKETIATVKGAKSFTKSDADGGRLFVGGIASTLMKKKFVEDVGIDVGSGGCGVVDGVLIKILTNSQGGAPLDEPGLIDAGDETLIDELMLDYSLLDETDYIYPTDSKGTAYFGYTTRGCVNRCGFCGVHKLERKFKRSSSIASVVSEVEKCYGMQRNLLLLDNNVFASPCFNEIIDEIKTAGFYKGNTGYIPPNLYLIAYNLLVEEHNNRTYIKKILGMYAEVLVKLEAEEKEAFALELAQRGLVYADTATRDAILAFHDTFSPLYEQHIYGTKPKRGLSRSVDFNQGVDARRMTVDIAKKLSEINIRPLRIAFDHWGFDPYNKNAQEKPMRTFYEAAVRMAYEYGGCRHFSNYLLYNSDKDKPEELYHRLRMNVELCDELDVQIYSFPMRYQPLYDEQYFDNRNYVGTNWHMKYIRAVQAILTATMGVVGRGIDYFRFAFGQDLDSFYKILLLPEVFIKERQRYDKGARNFFEKTTGKKSDFSTEIYTRDGDMVSRWWNALNALAPEQRLIVEDIIKANDFSDEVVIAADADVQTVLEFYRLKYIKPPKKQDTTRKAGVA